MNALSHYVELIEGTDKKMINFLKKIDELQNKKEGLKEKLIVMGNREK